MPAAVASEFSKLQRSCRRGSQQSSWQGRGRRRRLLEMARAPGFRVLMMACQLAAAGRVRGRCVLLQLPCAGRPAVLGSGQVFRGRREALVVAVVAVLVVHVVPVVPVAVVLWPPPRPLEPLEQTPPPPPSSPPWHRGRALRRSGAAGVGRAFDASHDALRPAGGRLQARALDPLLVCASAPWLPRRGRQKGASEKSAPSSGCFCRRGRPSHGRWTGPPELWISSRRGHATCCCRCCAVGAGSVAEAVAHARELPGVSLLNDARGEATAILLLLPESDLPALNHLGRNAPVHGQARGGRSRAWC